MPYDHAMADQTTQDENGKVYKNGRLQVQSGTPGVGGAISDAVKALQSAFAPRSLTQRGQRTDKAIDEDSGSNLGDKF